MQHFLTLKLYLQPLIFQQKSPDMKNKIYFQVKRVFLDYHCQEKKSDFEDIQSACLVKILLEKVYVQGSSHLFKETDKIQSLSWRAEQSYEVNKM